MLNKLLLIDSLLKETDASKRNSLAIDLSNNFSGDIEVYNALVMLIKTPVLQNQRGTLVYCLRKFDLGQSFVLFIELVINGNFEVAHQAAALINSIEIIEGSDAGLGYNKLTSVRLEKVEKWRLALIKEIIGMFD